jgi:hypothetical protein
MKKTKKLKAQEKHLKSQLIKKLKASGINEKWASSHIEVCF